jgi:hypothetical protein
MRECLGYLRGRQRVAGSTGPELLSGPISSSVLGTLGVYHYACRLHTGCTIAAEWGYTSQESGKFS